MIQMKKLTWMLAIMACVFIGQLVHGQTTADTTKVFMVETWDDNVFFGKLLFNRNDTVALTTQFIGNVYFKRSGIKDMRWVKPSSIHGSKVWGENAQDSRYLFTPNGYGLKQGEGYYQNIWVLWNQASVGITDNISIGAGIVPLFLFTSPYNPVWLTTKVSIPIVKDKINVGGGLLVAKLTGEEGRIGVAYGVGTYGDRDANVTLGMGYGFINKEWAKRPLFSASAMKRVSQNFFLLTDNYLILAGEEHLILFSMGGRALINRAGIDFGLIMPQTALGEGFVAIPWLGYSVGFGRH